MGARSVKSALARPRGALLSAWSPGATGQAEIVKNGDVIVSFHGDISPQKLPRDRSRPGRRCRWAPRSRRTDPADPPVLERIVLAINSHGVIQSKGLPTCPLAKLSRSQPAARLSAPAATPWSATATSPPASPCPARAPFASNGPLLAFNGTYKGTPGDLRPGRHRSTLPLTYVIVFEISKTKGTFGTRLDATLPPIASEYGYISAFDMSLSRQYSAGGKKLSYASAGCPAPKGLNVASFPLARASYKFSGGRTLTQTLQRDCKVLGK